MDFIGVVTVIGALGTIATLAVTVPVLVLTRRSVALSKHALDLAQRQEDRGTERSAVDWYAREIEQGRVEISNQGLDAAYEVTLEVWDAHDLRTEFEGEIGDGGRVIIELPHRREHGADPVDMPVRISPRVPDEPPTAPDLPSQFMPRGLAERFAEQRTGWERMKAAQDQQDALERKLRWKAESDQISVRVTWRSPLGRWSSELVPVTFGV